MVSSFLLSLLLLLLHFVVLLEAFAMMGSSRALPREGRLPLLPNARSWRWRLLNVHMYMYWRVSTRCYGPGSPSSGSRSWDLGAWVGEVVCDALAAESLVVGCPYRQRDPLRKAIRWSVTPSEAVHRWVRGHVEAPDGDEDDERSPQGNAWADGYADVAAWKSARGHWVALPLEWGSA